MTMLSMQYEIIVERGTCSSGLGKSIVDAINVLFNKTTIM